MKSSIVPHPAVAVLLGLGESPDVARYLLGLNVYISGFMGWTFHGELYCRPGGSIADTRREDLPDFVGDERLAMQAEEQVPSAEYTCYLGLVTAADGNDSKPARLYRMIHASAVKRCEAIVLLLKQHPLRGI